MMCLKSLFEEWLAQQICPKYFIARYLISIPRTEVSVFKLCDEELLVNFAAFKVLLV